jgi:predicted DsbA family dithiol-disulfide isomerase
LEKRTFSRAVDADWTRSRELGIRAVPTFVMNNRSIVGAQSYEVLEEFIKDETLSRNDG